MSLRNIALTIAFSGACFSQVTMPDGTKLRVRLEQPLSSGSAEVGQPVELAVAEAVKVNDVVVIKEGARVTGTVTEAVPKRRMGRAGKLDFSIDRVSALDGQWVPIRYTLQKKSGQSHAVRTGIITAGVAIAFWPAAPVMLLMKGKDITINKGVSFDVFTDTTHVLAMTPPGVKPATQAAAAPAAQPPSGTPATPAPAGGSATVTITASAPGAEIEVNGAFMGNTPTTLALSPGSHQITVKSGSQQWARTIQVTGGSTVSVHAALTESAPVAQNRQ
jgi:hypothetical protein